MRFQVLECLLRPTGELRRNAAGFCRVELPRIFPGRENILDQMKRCHAFSTGVRNPILSMTDDPKTLFRSIDAQNWKLADLLQYVDDRLAAELRQVQWLLGIHCALILSIWIMKGKVPNVVVYTNQSITNGMVEHAVFRYGLILETNAIGCHPRVRCSLCVPGISKNMCARACVPASMCLYVFEPLGSTCTRPSRCHLCARRKMAPLTIRSSVRLSRQPLLIC